MSLLPVASAARRTAVAATVAATSMGVGAASTRRIAPAIAATPRPRYNATSTQSQSTSSVRDSNDGHRSSPQPPPPPPPSSGSSSISMQVGPLFLTLTLTGLAVTAYGLYSYYTSFSTWPKPIAKDLRAALKAKRSGEYRKAEHKFRAALQTARGMSEDELRGDKLLKVTGIAVALASMLEEEAGGGRALLPAYEVYLDAWRECLTTTAGGAGAGSEESVLGRSGPERARAVALSQKLGQVALRIADVPDEAAADVGSGSYAQQAVRALNSGKGDQQEGIDAAAQPVVLPTQADARQAAEKHLVWTVEELLRLALPEDVQSNARQSMAADATASSSSSSSSSPPSPPTVSLADLDLPPWIARTDLLSSLESLGTFYASQGRVEYAVPLYLQALELLMPPKAKQQQQQQRGSKPTVADRCRAAVVMNNLSQVFLEGKTPDEAAVREAQAAAGGKVGLASSWARKGLAVVQETNRQVGWDLEQPQKDAQAQSEDKRLEYGGDVARLEVVRGECLSCEVALLVNLGVLASLSEDKCEARRYLQRAWRLADREGYRAAKARASSLLSGLERFGSAGAAQEKRR